MSAPQVYQVVLAGGEGGGAEGHLTFYEKGLKELKIAIKICFQMFVLLRPLKEYLVNRNSFIEDIF